MGNCSWPETLVILFLIYEADIYFKIEMKKSSSHQSAIFLLLLLLLLFFLFLASNQLSSRSIVTQLTRVDIANNRKQLQSLALQKKRKCLLCCENTEANSICLPVFQNP